MTDALIMVLCGVAFVAGETVLGVLAVQLQHIMIPGNLCQNRSCGDRRGCGIPLDHRYRWDSFQLRRAVPIDIGGVRPNRKPLYCFFDCQHRRSQNVQSVDFFFAYRADLIGYRLFCNQAIQRFPLFLAEFF